MWTNAHAALLQRYAERFGLPGLDGASARAWTLRLAEQFAFSFPAEGWGTKRADPGRPLSTDVICTRSPFVGYDVLLSQGVAAAPGEPGQRLDAWPPPLDLAGQVFIAVLAHDHLGWATPSPAPLDPPVVAPPSPDPVPLRADLAALRAEVAALRGEINAMHTDLGGLALAMASTHNAAIAARDSARVAQPAPDYRGRVFGQTITLTPVPK